MRVPWLWEETHVQDAVGSNPDTGYWMDIFHITLLQKFKCFFMKMTENKLK